MLWQLPCKTLLNPLRRDSTEKHRSSSKAPKKQTLHVLTRGKFEQEGKESGLVLALVDKQALQIPSDHTVDLPLAIIKLLKEFQDVTID